ncbi:dentin sialophosphoprotein [Drosophila subpulchrella]|uniref:dentin sialophosphoprotein n=1 Tax=Drosophila subpulchrella TaxID=1486046 RepID=UPI0018A1A878|nr:dentin sialophosphoprotein [Drosophila subpulchrella]
MSGYTDLTKLETSRNCLRRIARHDEQQFSKDSIVNVMEKFVKTVNIMDDTILVPCRLMDRQIGDSTDIIPATGKDSTANQLTQSSSAHGKRGAAHSKNVQDFLSASELFNLYNMLNSLKKDLLWTANQEDDEQHPQEQLNASPNPTSNCNPSESKTESSGSPSTSATGSVKGHVRRTSTASMMSTNSVSNMSDSDSDISQENDSGLESDGNKSDHAQSTDGSDIVDVAKSKQGSGDKATELAQRCRRHLNGLYQCLEQMTEAANYLTARYQSDIGPV